MLPRNLCNLQRNNGVIKVPLELQELVLVLQQTGTSATRRVVVLFITQTFGCTISWGLLAEYVKRIN